MVSEVKIAERKSKRMVNTSHKIEKLLKNSFPMGSGVEVESKKRKRFEDD